jgi:crotonobetainyl-CoA:carnitine CoA-transferase CaiB-like acyl-CoA transferase
LTTDAKDAVPDPRATPGFLSGVRVLELADELGEYCGKVLAGLGADVIKIEPLGGEKTRRYGPFLGDVANPNHSLHFWHYNFGKRGAVIDIESSVGRAQFLSLAATADVVIDTRSKDYLSGLGIGYELLSRRHPGLVYVRISPFGDSGPWSEFHASDLVHLALGGMMMNCGYDPEPSGEYDLPPIAPQMWHAYHVTGEITAIQIIAALLYRQETGIGQALSSSVHDAVSKNTETDIPNWVYLRQPHYRRTCRHSLPTPDASSWIARTKDGRWVLPYRTYLPGFLTSPKAIFEVLRKYEMQFDLDDAKYMDPEYLSLNPPVK